MTVLAQIPGLFITNSIQSTQQGSSSTPFVSNTVRLLDSNNRAITKTWAAYFGAHFRFYRYDTIKVTLYTVTSPLLTARLAWSVTWGPRERFSQPIENETHTIVTCSGTQVHHFELPYHYDKPLLRTDDVVAHFNTFCLQPPNSFDGNMTEIYYIGFISYNGIEYFSLCANNSQLATTLPVAQSLVMGDSTTPGLYSFGSERVSKYEPQMPPTKSLHTAMRRWSRELAFGQVGAHERTVSLEDAGFFTQEQFEFAPKWQVLSAPFLYCTGGIEYKLWTQKTGASSSSTMGAALQGKFGAFTLGDDGSTYTDTNTMPTIDIEVPWVSDMSATTQGATYTGTVYPTELYATIPNGDGDIDNWSRAGTSYKVMTANRLPGFTW